MLAALLAAAALVTSSWGFTADPGTRFPDGVSTEVVSFGGTVYAWTSTTQGLVGYRSTDGLTFSSLGDGLLPPGADAAVVPLPQGGWRMYFTRQDASGKVIASAVSGDLLNWTVEPGVRLELGPNRAAGVPAAVVLPDGRVRLYYVEPGASGESIDSAVSTDGLTFTKESGARLTGGYVDPSVAELSNGSWLMIASTSPSAKQRLFVATSPDGLAWTLDPKPVLDPEDANAFDPTLLPLGGGRFRVYYTVAPLGAQLTGPYQVESGILARTAAHAAKPKTTKPKRKKKR